MSDSETQQTSSFQQKSNMGVPIAIVVAAGLIAGAIYFSGGIGGGTGPAATNSDGDQPDTQVTPEVSVKPINEDDHIRGNPNAPIVLIEYSDFDCPFCKRHHETMNRIIEEYGPSSDVAWVYRHMPLAQLHPNAPKVAEASECVAELAGNDGFWKFADLAFGERGTNDPTDQLRISEFAELAGADKGEFELCLNSGKYTEAITEDIREAAETGARGTPHTLVFVGDEFVAPINGAQDYSFVKSNIDAVLAQIRGGDHDAE